MDTFRELLVLVQKMESHLSRLVNALCASERCVLCGKIDVDYGDPGVDPAKLTQPRPTGNTHLICLQIWEAAQRAKR